MATNKAINSTEVIDQNPQGGGSYVRNKDGSLAVNQADLQKTNPANDAAGTDIPKE